MEDDSNINRKGTLHGLVSKSMLANRLKLPGSDKKTSLFTDAPTAPKADPAGGVAPSLLAVPGGGDGRGSATPGGKSPNRNSIDVGARRDDEIKPVKSIMAELTEAPLPLQYVIQNLDTRVQATGLYKEFMLFIPFIILFFVFYLNGRNIEENHMSGAAVRKPLLENVFPSVKRNLQTAAQWPADGSTIELPEDRMFSGVTRAKHFQQWFQDVVVPATWDCDHPDIRHNPLQRRGQHTSLGAMQMRVLLMRNNSCDVNAVYAVNKNKSLSCYAPFSSSTQNTDDLCGVPNPAAKAETLWVYRSTGIISSTRTTGRLMTYPGGGYTATVPFNATCNEALAFGDMLFSNAATDTRSCGIIRDDTTRFVILEWFEYNPSTDTFLSSKLFFEVSEGGRWLPTFQFRAFPVWSKTRFSQTGFDIFFLIFVLYFWYQFITTWLKHYQRTQKALEFLLDAWNVIELTNLVTFLAVLILRFIWWSQSIQKQVNLPFSDGYPNSLDAIVLLYSYQIYANAVNAVITVLKTLKYMRLNNRMNILTRTIDACKESIAGVLILFIFIVAAYAVSGTSLYGNNMEAFRSTDTSFATLLFMLFGNFDYDGMKQVQPVLTGIYFFTYVILSQFLLLNFIIAILSEGFSQVSTSSAIEPLDQVLLRQLSSLRYTLHPQNLKQWILLSLSGKSRNDLIFEMTKYLQEHMDLIELQSPELLDNDLPITKADLKNWLPEHLDEDIGDFYMAVLWDDIAHDYEIDIQSEEYQQKKEIEALIKKGVLSVVTTTVDSFAEAEAKVKDVETAVSKLESFVR